MKPAQGAAWALAGNASASASAASRGIVTIVIVSLRESPARSLVVRVMLRRVRPPRKPVGISGNEGQTRISRPGVPATGNPWDGKMRV
ncbi:MAG: hypothetical protein BroJett026_09460 [Betaproteobacteria bacterium]|nr:MAG: hypothetical protein BroJett026_09460 [Betaproteobacteria bacterium]